MRGEYFYRTNSAISRTAALKFSLHEALTLSAYLNKTLKRYYMGKTQHLENRVCKKANI